MITVSLHLHQKDWRLTVEVKEDATGSVLLIARDNTPMRTIRRMRKLIDNLLKEVEK